MRLQRLIQLARELFLRGMFVQAREAPVAQDRYAGDQHGFDRVRFERVI